VARLAHGLRAERVRANLERLRAEIAQAARAAGRDPAGVELLAACKYVPLEELPALAEAGIAHLGENRAQELVRKASARGGELFTWDFIGALQSKHVRAIVPHVRLIHSLASESALRELQRVADRARPGIRVLIEVNVAGDPSKGGVAVEELPDYLARSPFPVAGLMTMPPLVHDPEQSRSHFRALRELAERHGLPELSMGTSQDFPVAVQEGATIVRIGARLYQ
jgi:PLP dependent protein